MQETRILPKEVRTNAVNIAEEPLPQAISAMISGKDVSKLLTSIRLGMLMEGSSLGTLFSLLVRVLSPVAVPSTLHARCSFPTTYASLTYLRVHSTR